MKNELLAGGVGTTLSVIGTVTQFNEILQTISFIVTIIGAIVSIVIVPIMSWYRKAKKDGKITKDEVEDLTKTIDKSVNDLKDKIDDGKE